jgi:hypothetical protein
MAGWVAGPRSDDILSMPTAMVWADGTLYQASLRGVAAERTDGSTGAIWLSELPATGIWIEGDQVLFSHHDRLMQVPRAGGAVTTLLDGGQRNDPSTAVDQPDLFGSGEALDSTAFYWTTIAYPQQDSLRAWRMLRVAGTLESFAPFPLALVKGLALVPDGVLVAGQYAGTEAPYYRAFVAPFANGAARELPADDQHWPTSIVSVESGGFLWNSWIREDVHEVWLSPADGARPRLLSPGLPGRMVGTSALAEGQGGRFLAGVETFDDGLMHGSAFFVAADGGVTRLGCGQPMNVPGAAAIAPDAVYWAVSDGDTWMLVKVARPPRG